MGMYDNLTCKVALPGLGVRDGEVFQTKSLFVAMATLTISEEGRLIDQLVRHKWDEPDVQQRKAPEFLPCRTILRGERDLMFHGDVIFFVCLPGEFKGDMVARFTEGQLQWIRTADSLPEVTRDVIYGRQE